MGGTKQFEKYAVPQKGRVLVADAEKLEGDMRGVILDDGCMSNPLAIVLPLRKGHGHFCCALTFALIELENKFVDRYRELFKESTTRDRRYSEIPT